MQTKLTNVENLSIRYSSSLNEHEESLLMLQPLPESLYCYSPIWDRLATNFNLLAIDMPGFGGSEARSDLFSADSMSTFIAKVIEHFELETVHILGPDIGAPIG